MKFLKIWILVLAIVAVSIAQLLPKEKEVTPDKHETVVLLHGLCRTSRSMKKMERSLSADGYCVINIDYPSRGATVEQLEKQVFEKLKKQLSDSGKVHFVTHSMGGVLLGRYLETETIPNLGNIVMLAPPSRGSEVVDKLGNQKLFQCLNGPAGNELGTNMRPLNFEHKKINVGIIAGDRSINPILSLLIPGPDDGKVAIARARPKGATDFIKLHATHTYVMKNSKAIKQTIQFLENGTFNKGEKDEENIG